MTAAVLDASAVLAMLLGEPGGEKVVSVLADSAIGALNWSEVVGHLARNGGAEADIRAELDPLPLARIAFDEALAYDAGLMAPTTRAAGLSMGDRACLALAARLGLPALTADRSWLPIATKLGSP